MEVDSDDCNHKREYFCEICVLDFTTQHELDEHTWSLLHNTNLNRKKGSDCIHGCSLCKQEFVGLLKFKEHLIEIDHQEKLQRWQNDQQPECSPEKIEDNSPKQQDENREMSNWAADDSRGLNYFSDAYNNRNLRGSWQSDRFPPGHPRNFFPHPQYHHRERYNRERIRSDENPEQHTGTHPPWIGGGGNIIPQEFRGGPPFNGGMINNYYLNQGNNQCLWRRNSRDGQHDGKANNAHDSYPVGGRRPSYDAVAGVSLRREPQTSFQPSRRNSWHESNVSEVKRAKGETEETAVKLNMQPASASNTKSEETAPSTQAKIECMSKEESCVDNKSKTSDGRRTNNELINSKHEQKGTASGTQAKGQNGSKEGSYIENMVKSPDSGRTSNELITSKREQKESTLITKTRAENGSKEGYLVYGTQESSDRSLSSDSPTGKNARKGKPRKLARPAEEEKKEGSGDMSSGGDLTQSKDTSLQLVTQDRISSHVEYENGGTVKDMERSTKLLDKTFNNEKGVATTGLKGDSPTGVSGDLSFAEKRESLSNQKSNHQTKGNKDPLLCSEGQLAEKRKGYQESLVSKGNSVTCLEKRNEPFNSSKRTVNSSQTTSKEQSLARISISSLKINSVSNSKQQAESSVKTSPLPTCGSFGTKNKAKFPHVGKNTGAKGKTFERTVNGENKPKQNDHSCYPTSSSNVGELPWEKKEGKLKSLLGMENQPKDFEDKQDGSLSTDSKTIKGPNTRPSITSSFSSSTNSLSPGSSKSSSRYTPGFSQLSLSRPQCSFVHIDGVQCSAKTWNKYCSYHQRVFKDEDSRSPDESSSSLSSSKTRDDTLQSRSPKGTFVHQTKLSRNVKISTSPKEVPRHSKASKVKNTDAGREPTLSKPYKNDGGTKESFDSSTDQTDCNSTYNRPREAIQTEASCKNIDLSSTILRASVNPIPDDTKDSEGDRSNIAYSCPKSRASVDGYVGTSIGASIDLSETVPRPGILTNHTNKIDREGSSSIDLSGTVTSLEGLLALHGDSSNIGSKKSLLIHGRSWKHAGSSTMDSGLSTDQYEKGVNRDLSRGSDNDIKLNGSVTQYELTGASHGHNRVDSKEQSKPDPPLLIKVKKEPGTEDEITPAAPKTEMIDLNFSTKLLGIPHSVVAPFNSALPSGKKPSAEITKSSNFFAQSPLLSSARSHGASSPKIPVISRQISPASTEEQPLGSAFSPPSLALDLSRFNLPPAVRKALADRYSMGKTGTGTTTTTHKDELPEGRRSQPLLTGMKTEESFDSFVKTKASPLPARLRSRGQRSISLDSTMIRRDHFEGSPRARIPDQGSLPNSHQLLNKRLIDGGHQSTELLSDTALAVPRTSSSVLPKGESDELHSRGLIDLSSTSYLDEMPMQRTTEASRLIADNSRPPSAVPVLNHRGLIDLNSSLKYSSSETLEASPEIKRKRLGSSIGSESASSMGGEKVVKRPKQEATSARDDKTATYRSGLNVQELLSIEREELNQLQNLNVVQSSLKSVRAQIQKLCTELDSLSTEEQRITLRMGELRNARLSILENACYERQGLRLSQGSERISRNETNTSATQDRREERTVSATPVLSVSQNETVCNIVNSSFRDSCEVSKGTAPLTYDGKLRGESSLNTGDVNQSGERDSTFGNATKLSTREETPQNKQLIDESEFDPKPGRSSSGENRGGDAASKASGSCSSKVSETSRTFKKFGSHSEPSDAAQGVTGTIGINPGENKVCKEQSRKAFRRKGKHLSPSERAFFRKKSFSSVNVSKTIEASRKKIHSVKENMKRWKHQQESIRDNSGRQSSDAYLSSQADTSASVAERHLSRLSRTPVRYEPSPQKTTKDFKKSSLFHSARKRSLDSRKHRLKERHGMGDIPRKKRKIDSTSCNTHCSKTIVSYGNGESTSAVAHTTTAHLGKLGSDEASVLDEIPTRDVDNKSQADDTASGVTRGPDQVQIPTSTVESLQEIMPQSKEHKRQIRPANRYEGHTGAVCGLKVHNGHLFACSADKTTREFNVQTGECVKVFQGHHLAVNCVEISEDKERLFTGSNDQSVRSYNIKTGACSYRFTFDGRVMCLHAAFGVLFVGLNTGVVASIDLVANKLLERLPCHEPRGVSCLTTATEGQRKLLCCGSFDSTITIRDYKTGLLIRTISDHSLTVLCLQVVENILYSGSADMKVLAHNLNTGELLRSFDGHTRSVSGLQVVGRVLVTSCLDKLIRCYDLTSGELLQVYGGQMDMIFSVLVSDGRIFSGGRDGSVMAVKLDLRVYHPCKWKNCTLNFGISSHLRDHLKEYHVIEQGTVGACHWFQCGHHFSAEDDISVVLKHVLGHVVTRTSRKTTN